MRNYKYKNEWSRYAFAENQEFADETEIKQKFSKFFHGSNINSVGGLPVLTTERISYINTEIEHTLIYGQSGSKKTRCLIAPLICTLASAGESMIITDIKGELSNGILAPKIRGSLESNGYNTYFLDFRGMQSDSIDLLNYPYSLFKMGKEDLAMQEIDGIVATLATEYNDAKDPFWHESAVAYLKGVILLLFYLCPSSKINMTTILNFCSYKGAEALEAALEELPKVKRNSELVLLESVLSNPENTKRCILSSAGQLIRAFTSNHKLSKMLSQSTFALENLLQERTALFIILPDETAAYDNIAGLLVKQITSYLVASAYNAPNGMLEHRMNFILDEFCNLFSTGNNNGQFGRALSTNRSRNIRYYLVVQGLSQLKNVYKDEAETILANVKNTYYLHSTDFALLKYLEETSGYSYDNKSEVQRPLMSVHDLCLEKTYDYAECYIKSGNIQFVTRLPDVDSIPWLWDFKDSYNIPIHKQNNVESWSTDELLIKLKKAPEDRLEKLFNNLFE